MSSTYVNTSQQGWGYAPIHSDVPVWPGYGNIWSGVYAPLPYWPQGSHPNAGTSGVGATIQQQAPPGVPGAQQPTQSDFYCAPVAPPMGHQVARPPPHTVGQVHPVYSAQAPQLYPLQPWAAPVAMAPAPAPIIAVPPLAYAPRLAPVLPIPAVTSPLASESPRSEYNDHDMAEFLSSMAFGIMVGQEDAWMAEQHKDFRRFVLTILRAMRLTKSTIILSLVYLSERWSLGNLTTPYSSERYDVFYLHFVVSLVLANKMHDDNTFTNASWCQATGISANEITRTELNWLVRVNWLINVECRPGSGFDKWHQCWSVFCQKQEDARQNSSPLILQSQQRAPPTVVLPNISPVSYPGAPELLYNGPTAVPADSVPVPAY